MIVHMVQPRMESKGVRLHPALWEQIEREAKRARLKSTDYLRRRIEDAFEFDPDGHKMPVHEHRERLADNESLSEAFK